jgi:hypothetical protein
MGRALTCALAVCICSTVFADEANDDARARVYFEIGRGEYELGDYQGALREFSAGYTLSHRVGFLINIGQAHHKLGHLDSAKDALTRFLAEAPPDNPERVDAQRLLAEVERARAARPGGMGAEAAAVAPASVGAPAPVSSTPGARTASPVQRAESGPHRRARRWPWILLGVGIAALAAGAAVGLVLGLSTDYGAYERSTCQVQGCLFFQGMR